MDFVPPLARPPGFRFREGARRTQRLRSPERATEASNLLPARRTGLAQQTPPRSLLFTPCGRVGKAAEQVGRGRTGRGPGRAGPGVRGGESGRWAESSRVPEHLEEQFVVLLGGLLVKDRYPASAGGSGDKHPLGPRERIRVDGG